MFDAFYSQDRARTFFHGHTFTAHRCALALESLDMIEERDVPSRLAAIGTRIHAALAPLQQSPKVRRLRHLGGMVAHDLVSPSQGYLSTRGAQIARIARAEGVLLRPLGNVVYTLPPRVHLRLPSRSHRPRDAAHRTPWSPGYAGITLHTEPGSSCHVFRASANNVTT
ncbi:MAG: aminotransferase class III-fold pyridoxal phosphate-dependent enzyme [Planctomycetota bacterium]